MKKYDIKQYIFIFITIFFLLFNVFVLNMTSKIYFLIFIFITFVISLKLYKIQKDSFPYRKQATLVNGIFGILQIAFYYVLGIKTGYKENLISLTSTTLLKLIIPLAIIIVLSELIRYMLIRSKDKNKLHYWLTILIFVLLDISMFGQNYDLSSLSDLLEFLGLIIFPSIFNNILFNKISLKFGSRPIIIYRLITSLYGYFIPVIPDLFVFFRSILKMVMPYIIYTAMSYMFERKLFEKAVSRKKALSIVAITGFILVVFLAMLISCQFKYGAITVGSKSMTGAIDKGDIVIFEKYENQNIEIGDILVFNYKDTTIVHRVVEIGILNNDYIYVTKGDKNDNPDSSHLYKEKIIGIYKARVKYLGYPTLWVNDLFNK